MSTKAAFLTAFGATNFTGAAKAISAPNTTTEAMTATAHGKVTGFGPVRLVNSGGALPTGLASATNYWLVVVDADTIKFATSAADANAATPVVVDITAAGSGTHTMQCTMQTLADILAGNVASVLTFPGNKDMQSDVNTIKFWTDAVYATF